MDQNQLIQLLSESAPQFAWLLGAGTSQSAGLSTAADLMWDLKRRHYCRQENQQISSNDVQNTAVQEKIAAYMQAHGFPSPGDPDEYSACFELVFKDDYERQRKYLKAMLSDDKISLATGNRVLAAMMSSGFAKAVFTTNFDTVLEKAIATVAGKDIVPFHIEGSYAANVALNNDEFPIYAKLHGDFRYSLEIYQRGHSGHAPKKVTIHKNTSFKEDEALGAIDAFNSQTEVELVQIVKSTNWFGIRYNMASTPEPDSYPVMRGTYLPVSSDEAFLWTQGSVKGVHMEGANRDVYKEGSLKPVPSPLIVRRFSESGGWYETCSGIVGLTKMDWNNNTLYKKLPVTLEYSQRFAKIIQQNPNLVDAEYDFRNFM